MLLDISFELLDINPQFKKNIAQVFTFERYFFICSDYFIYICNI